jgi:hypothetical protein
MTIKKFIKILPYVFLAGILICVPAFVLPNLQKDYNPQDKTIQGVVSIWHIENFEGGNSSRHQFLLSQMIALEKKHKGLLVSIQSFTKAQAQNQIENGILPDLVSFGTGVGDIFSDYAQDYQGRLNIRPEFIKAGEKGDKVKAVAYMTGGYLLFCNSELAKTMGIDTNNNLIDNIFIDGYVYNKGKSIRYSLVTARENNLSLAAVLKNTVGVFQKNSYFEAQSQFDAYNMFVSKNALMLLGTQRDLNRVINRINQNNMFESEILYLKGYTDLVQYLSVTAKTAEKQQKARLVIEYLTNNYAQSALCEIGMFSVDGDNYHTHDMLKRMQNAINQPLITPNAFSGQDTMDYYHDLCKKALNGDIQSLNEIKAELGL